MATVIASHWSTVDYRHVGLGVALPGGRQSYARLALAALLAYLA
jgi:hypothetical protein